MKKSGHSTATGSVCPFSIQDSTTPTLIEKMTGSFLPPSIKI
ncbi:hypothetical protein [Cohnella herbarum]|nr:hypothetical protein [Cohnella herbarum]